MGNAAKSENEKKWRSCGCCHAQTAMSIVAIMMILLSILALFFSSEFSFVFVGTLYLASGISAIIAVCKINWKFLVATMVIIGVFLILFAFQVFALLIEMLIQSFTFIPWVALGVNLALVFLHTWFFCVALKCFQFLKNRTAHLNANVIDAVTLRELPHQPKKLIDASSSPFSLHSEEKSDVQ